MLRHPWATSCTCQPTSMSGLDAGRQATLQDSVYFGLLLLCTVDPLCILLVFLQALAAPFKVRKQS